MIYTFYSFKGGVGRSMALANVAELFYRARLEVLMVDWDLEAPGLERFFAIRAHKVLEHPGVIDMLLDYQQKMAQPPVQGTEVEELALPLDGLEQYLLDVYPGEIGKGRLWLLPAGKRAGKHFAHYANLVRTFDWHDFYQNWEGELFFEWLRHQFLDLADVVLIDSRTGVAEMGGVCTYQLADIVVMFCSPNQQSLDGTYEMARNFKRPEVRTLRGGRPLEILIVPARVEDRAEMQLLNEFRRQFFERFSEFSPKVLEGGSESLWQLKIPHVPYYAFNEVVAVREKVGAYSESMIGAFVSLKEVMLRLAGTKLMARLAETGRVQKQVLTSPARLFICYKCNVDPDRELAHYLYEFLTSHGHDVFVDVTLRTGEAWLEEIDRQIKASDFLVVLLSEESADSEMVQAQVRRAYEYRKLQGRPHTLPVRIAYEGLLPYSVDAFLDPLQYVVWHSKADNERVSQDILAAIEGRLPKRAPIQARPVAEGLTISEDGRPVAEDESLTPPLSEFDPRFLETLEAPGGAVKLRDKFYIERDADARLRREVVKSGTTTTIRAARQTGKSSLLVRGLHHARQNGAKVVTLDLQRVDRDCLETPDAFLHYLAEFIVGKLRLDLAEVERLWRGSLGPQDKLTYLMENYILFESDAPIVLAMDDVDRLLQTPFHNDFFGLVRSWHNSRALDDRWNKLNIVMVISTEPYLLIADVSQSPFNVGLRLYLKDFNEAQVRDLNRRHRSPVKESDFPQLMELLSGHPYLTRKALYTLITEQWAWADLVRGAATDHGPFGDHLLRHHWLLRDEPDLREALKQIILHNRCPDEMAFFRLLRAGLVKGSSDVCRCRCDLYRMYFEDKV